MPLPQSNVLLVDAAGNTLIDANGVIVQGNVAHDAPDSGNPVKIGGKTNSSNPTGVSDGDRTDAHFDSRGRLGIFIVEKNGPSNVKVENMGADGSGGGNVALWAKAALHLLGPDDGFDRGRGAGNSGPGLGAMNVAPIGGDITLRASAIIGETSGTSTLVANLGWVKKMSGVLDVTAVPTGGTPTLNVRLQTLLANGLWQDIVSFVQVAGTISTQPFAYDPASCCVPIPTDSGS